MNDFIFGIGAGILAIFAFLGVILLAMIEVFLRHPLIISLIVILVLVLIKNGCM